MTHTPEDLKAAEDECDHDYVIVEGEQGDGIYLQTWVYLECEKCGHQKKYDGRVRLEDDVL